MAIERWQGPSRLRDESGKEMSSEVGGRRSEVGGRNLEWEARTQHLISCKVDL